MIVGFMRATILYILILWVIRTMGKRQVGELQPFELVITILIADFAAAPIENTGIPLMNGVVPIITLLFLEVVFSSLMLKSQWARRIIDGTPSVVMDKGKIIYKELKKQRININDLLERLRILGYPNLQELDYVIIEPDGQLSVIPKAENQPLTPKDMNIEVNSNKTMPIALITDGKRNKHNMQRVGYDNVQLDKQLKKQGMKEDKEVLLAYLDDQGNLHIQRKAKGDQ